LSDYLIKKYICLKETVWAEKKLTSYSGSFSAILFGLEAVFKYPIKFNQF
jgi:hypothetical protein